MRKLKKMAPLRPLSLGAIEFVMSQQPPLLAYDKHAPDESNASSTVQRGKRAAKAS